MTAGADEAKPSDTPSQRLRDLLKSSPLPMTVLQVRDALGIAGSKETIALRNLMHKMASCGILNTHEGDEGPKSFSIGRELKRTQNPAGLSAAEKRRLSSQRARLKAGGVTREQYLAQAEQRRKAREERALAAKREKRAKKKAEESSFLGVVAKHLGAKAAPAKLAPPPAPAPSRAPETIEQWMKRTGQQPEKLPGLKESAPVGRRPSLGVLGVR